MQYQPGLPRKRGNVDGRYISEGGVSYEKIAFACRALRRDGPGSWGLCPARKRRAASGRTSCAQDRQDRLSPGRALSLLVAPRLSSLRLWTSSRLAPPPLASGLLAQPPLAPSSLASPLLRPSTLLLSLLRTALLRSLLSPAVCILHRLVLVVSRTATSPNAKRKRQGLRPGVFLFRHLNLGCSQTAFHLRYRSRL